MTRYQMIQALTKYELQWLVDNFEHLQDVTDFFASGGYSNLTDEGLEKMCELKLEATE